MSSFMAKPTVIWTLQFAVIVRIWWNGQVLIPLKLKHQPKIIIEPFLFNLTVITVSPDHHTLHVLLLYCESQAGGILASRGEGEVQGGSVLGNLKTAYSYTNTPTHPHTTPTPPTHTHKHAHKNHHNTLAHIGKRHAFSRSVSSGSGVCNFVPCRHVSLWQASSLQLLLTLVLLSSSLHCTPPPHTLLHSDHSTVQ